MKRTVLFALLAALIGCGGSSSSEKIDGHWAGELDDANGSAFNFIAMLAQNSGHTVKITNFTLGTTSSCFSTSTTQTAQFTKTGNFQGVPTGPFTMTISTSTGASSNVLSLVGTVNASAEKNENISGTWTLTGQSDCNDSGTFSMIPLPPV